MLMAAVALGRWRGFRLFPSLFSFFDFFDIFDGILVEILETVLAAKLDFAVLVFIGIGFAHIATELFTGDDAGFERVGFEFCGGLFGCQEDQRGRQRDTDQEDC